MFTTSECGAVWYAEDEDEGRDCVLPRGHTAEHSFEPTPQYRPPKEDPMFPELSSRENQVIEMALEHFSTSQIGEALNISTNTVIAHRNRAKLKLRVKTMREIFLLSKGSDLL